MKGLPYIPSIVGQANVTEIRSIVDQFPEILDRAREDWGKFKVGVKAGVFGSVSNGAARRAEILDWFEDFPRLWETIRPHFVFTPEGLIKAHVPDVVKEADDFVEKLQPGQIDRQLGVGFIIIAGVLIAAAVGVAGVVWAVGYTRKQGNVSKLIDETVAGRIDPVILQKAIQAESGGGLFGGISDLLKLVFIGGAALLILPLLSARRR